MSAVTVFAQTLPLLPPSITFLGGWDQGVILGPGAWSQSQWVAPDRFQLVTDRVRNGKYAVRVEVRPGDDPIHSGAERAEVATMRDPTGNSMYENTNSGTQYYAISVYLPTDWQPPIGSNDTAKWGAFFQLHGPDVYHASPVIELLALDHFRVDMEVGDLDYCGKDNMKCLHTFNELSDGGKLNLGTWNDFVVAIKFAKTFTGSVDVWHRVEGQSTFNHVLSLTNIPTLQYKTSVDGGVVGNHYWKTGFYRSKETFTNVLWEDGPVRGSTFDAVVAAAFPTTQTTLTPTPKLSSTPVPPAALTVQPTKVINPTVTPTTGATGTSISITVLLHGIGKGGDNVNPASGGNLNPFHLQRTLSVYFTDVNNQVTMKQGTIAYNATTGNFQGTINLGTITSGAYTVRLVTPQYLGKIIPGIVSLTNGKTTAIQAQSLTTGDVNGDNRLNILDYNMILDCFSDLGAPRNCTDPNKKLMADLTDDGSVNQFDYNLFLRELSVQSGQ